MAGEDDIIDDLINFQKTQDEDSYFKNLFELSPDLCYLVSTTGIILDINQTALDIIGSTKDEIVGRYIVSTIYPNAQQRAKELIKKWQMNGYLKNEEITITTMKGDRPVLLSVENVKDTSGNIIYSILIQKDISDIKKAHEETERILDAAADGIRIVTKDYKVKKINKTMADLVAVDPQNAIGMTCHKMFRSNAHCGTDKCSLIQILKTGQRYIYEDVRHTQNGKKISVLVSVSPYIGDNNEIIGIIEDFRDITEIKRIEERLVEGEQRFRYLFEKMSSGVAVYDAFNEGEDFIIKDFNHAAERIEHVNKNDIAGRKVTEVFPAVKDFGLFDVFRRVYQTGESEQYPIKMYKDDRIEGWRENYVYKLPSGEIVAVYDDVTERKKAEINLQEAHLQLKKINEELDKRIIEKTKDLRESEERLELAINGAEMGMWDYHIPTGNVQYSDNWGLILGYQPEEIKPTVETWKDIIHPDDKKHVVETLNKNIKGEIDFYECEQRLKTKNESYRWILARGKVVERDSYGNAVRHAGTYIDINEKKLIENKLIESNKKITDLLNQKDEFIHMLGHDLKNPLSVIFTLLPMLERMSHSPKESEIVSRLAQNTKRMKEMIDETIKLATLDALSQTIKPVEFCLKQEIQNIVNENSHFLEKYDYSIHIDVHTDCVVYCDKHQFYDLVSNLILNAIKYTPDDKHGELIIKGFCDNEELFLQFKDNGIGIAEDKKNIIFDRFYKYGTPRNGMTSSGLGLSICKSIVEKHGGKIWVESEGEGKGSNFKLCFPCRIVT